MTVQEAIKTLQPILRKADGCTKEALDMAIRCLERNIVKADIDSIINAVERETGVTEQEMCNRGRHREYAEARAIVSWLARRYTSMTLTSIGKRLGRDHISVIHYVRMVGSWMEEPRLNIRGARITQKLIDEIEQ